MSAAFDFDLKPWHLFPFFFRPFGACSPFVELTHRLRSGLQSFAPSELRGLSRLRVALNVLDPERRRRRRGPVLLGRLDSWGRLSPHEPLQPELSPHRRSPRWPAGRRSRGLL